jgi:hypothetical protein
MSENCGLAKGCLDNAETVQLSVGGNTQILVLYTCDIHTIKY